MSDVSAGKYLGGFTGNFDIKANQTALKGQQKTSDAVNTAKANSGAELTVIDAAGNATVHTAKVEKGTFSNAKPTASGFITVDNLAAPGAKVDKTKPLAIDPSISSKLGGEVMILVDEKNQTKVINTNKDQIVNNYLAEPTDKKVDAAYVVSGDDNSVNKKLSANVITDLNANYRNTDKASKEVGLLKEGQVKTGMNAMIGELKNISSNTSQLEVQSRERTQKFNGDIAKPQQRLDSANSNWNSSSRAEDQKINNAGEELREAKFPGVRDTEGAINSAREMVNNGKGYLQNATKKVSDSGNEVGRLENIKVATNGIVSQNQSLEGSNKKIAYDMANYLVNRKDQLIDLKGSLNNKAVYYESMAETESRKPAAPTGTASVGMTREEADKIAQKISGGDSWISKEDLTNNGLAYLAEAGASRDKVAGTDNKISTQEFSDAILLGKVNLPKPAGATAPTPGNSTSTDPFNSSSKPSSGGGNSTSTDPFNSGSKPSSGGGNSTSADPFSNNNGQYKNNNAVQDFRRRANEIRSDANSIDMRIESIGGVIREARAGGPESSNFRFAVNKLSDGNSYSGGYNYVLNDKDAGYNYFNEDKSDKSIINSNFLKPYDNNNNAIRENNRQIERNVAEYKSNVGPANQRLQEAKVNESQANGNLQGAQSKLTQLSADLDRINSRPALTESTPTVRSAKNSLDSAVKNKDSVVGPSAPFTKERNSSQGVVDSLTESHSSDIKAVNAKVAANSAQAQQKINETKRNLGL